jgi:NitT/TauT family transport system substrate-binding protein
MPPSLRPSRLTRAARVLALAGMTTASFFMSAAAEAQTRVRFTIDWRFEAPAGLFLLGLERGYFKEEGLDVTIDPGNGSRESVTRVASGTYDMGFGDLNAMIRFRDENPQADVKAVMIVYDKPPYAIVGRKSRGISNDLKSLQGKKFGAPAPDAAYQQWPIFKAVNKIDDKDMKFENVGFPVREPMLAQGEVDAVFGFSISSVITVKARGVPADDIVQILMADYGVELYGNGVMVNGKFAQENPETVRKMLRAINRSIKEAIKNPAAAVDAVLKRNDVARREVEMERFAMVVSQNVMTDWAKANGIGGIDKGRFERAIDQIGLTMTFKNKPKVDDVFTDAFLPPAADRKIN